MNLHKRGSADRLAVSRMRGARPILALLVTVGLLALVAVVPAMANGRAGVTTSPRVSAKAQGLVYAGLRKTDRGPCGDLYRLVTPGRGVMCTHGPDPAPAGVDVTRFRTVTDLRGRSTAAASATSADSVPCIDDGVSGSRVQAVYAVASDRTDRYGSIAPMIAGWAGQMDSAMNQSAAETGGERHIRFVTNADCTLNVAHVVLSATGDDTFSNTATELSAMGFNRTDRKYLIWADASMYCGIAGVIADDTAGSANQSNSSTGYARVDTGCWGRSDHLSELHELTHTLGGVQLGAPHSSGGFHCTDEYDAMCYQDSATATLTFPCPSSHEWLLDCNHDDYFHTSPPSGSYLATHWNVADSVFLSGASTSTSPAPSPSPTPSPSPAPTATSTTAFSGSVSAKRTVKTFGLTVGAGDTANSLQFSATGKNKGTATLRLRVLDANGSVLMDTSGPSVVRSTVMLPAGGYTWEVSGSTSASFTLAVTYRLP